MQSGRESPNSITVSTIGWAYLEGGPTYVLVIFVLLGIIFNLIDYYRNKSIKHELFWIMALLIVIKPEWDPFYGIVQLIQMFILINILNYFLIVKIKHLK